MGNKLSFKGNVYIDDATGYASPTWDKVQGVVDIDMPFSMTEADVSTRDCDFKLSEATLAEASITFNLIYNDANTTFETLRLAAVARTKILIAITDGPIATTGTKGFKFIGQIFDFPWSQKLTDKQEFSVTVKPTEHGSDVPVWFTIS